MSQIGGIKNPPCQSKQGGNLNFYHEEHYMLNLNQLQEVLSEIISLAKSNGVKDNTATTKLLTAKPSRHSLAIFVPTLSTGAMLSYSAFTVYGGLIEPNIIPFLGNKFSRLVAVVETCHPICGVVSLTKLLGASPC